MKTLIRRWLTVLGAVFLVMIIFLGIMMGMALVVNELSTLRIVGMIIMAISIASGVTLEYYAFERL